MNVIDHNYALKIDLFIKEMNEIDSNEYFYQNRIRFASYLIDAVHAIADCYERHKNQLNGTDKEFVRAFCYLNNQLKHDRQLEVFSTQFYSAALPTYLPCSPGSTSCYIFWKDFDDHGNARAEGKRKHYDLYLKNKDVTETLSNVKRILDCVVM